MEGIFHNTISNSHLHVTTAAIYIPSLPLVDSCGLPLLELLTLLCCDSVSLETRCRGCRSHDSSGRCDWLNEVAVSMLDTTVSTDDVNSRSLITCGTA